MNINSLDIETYHYYDLQKDNKIFAYCCSSIINDELKTFYGENVINETLDYITSLNISIKNIYVHNLNYDGRFLLLYFLENGWKLDFLIHNDRIINMIFYKNDIKIEFKCSYMLFPISLKSAGISIKKEKMIFPYNIIKRVRDIYYRGNLAKKDFNSVTDFRNYVKEYGNKIDLKEYTIKYCENDVILTKKFVEDYLKELEIKEWIEINEKNNISNTISSLSLKIFDEKFIYNGMEIRNPIKIYEEFIRNSYKGGMCMVYGNPREDEVVYHSDYTGFYGQIMKDEFGVGEPEFLSKNEINKLKYGNLPYGFYKVKVKTDLKYPILGLNIGGKLEFMNGVFEGTFFSDELNFFSELDGKILEIYEALVYKRTLPLFKRYIEELDLYKSEGGVKKMLGKCLTNHLYGKLAMNIKEDIDFIIKKENVSKIEKIVGRKNIIRIVDLISEICILKMKTKEFDKIKDLDIFEIHENDIFMDEKKYSNISLASAITAKGRVRLMKDGLMLEKMGGRLLYTDTDSHFVAFPKDFKILGFKSESGVYFDEKKPETVLSFALFVKPKFYLSKYNDENGNEIDVNKIKGGSKDVDVERVILAIKNGENYVVRDISFISKKKFVLTAGKLDKVFDCHKQLKRIWVDKNRFETIPKIYGITYK